MTLIFVDPDVLDVDEELLQQYLIHRSIAACAQANDRPNLAVLDAILIGDVEPDGHPEVWLSELWAEFVATDYDGDFAAAYADLTSWAARTNGPPAPTLQGEHAYEAHPPTEI